MNYKKIKYVKTAPITKSNGTIYFISNAKAGDFVICKKLTGIDKQLLPKPGKIVSETPFHFLIDLGIYKTSVSKASIYCGDEILYFRS